MALLALVGLAYAIFSLAWRGASSPGRSLMPLRGRTAIFYFWLVLNIVWFAAGIHERDFQKKPKWLRKPPPPQSPSLSALPPALAASHVPYLSDPVLRLLRLSYGVGMASCWPLLANLFVVLLPVDRSLFLLSCLGVGHEEGVLAHALCGGAVWIWASAHALLTQAPMLAAGLWRLIVLAPRDGTETKGTSNFMGLMAWLALCALGASSLAPLRRAAFNSFQRLHLALAPAVMILACLHDSKIFWYAMFGAVLYGADLVQRWALRRRSAVAVATLYPLSTSSTLTLTAPGGMYDKSTTALSDGAAGATGDSMTVNVGGGGIAADAITADANLTAADGGVYRKAASCTAAVTLLDGSNGCAGGGGGGAKFVVLRIPTGCSPGCVAGQHVFIKVPAVSRWEWHPYSVAAHDDSGFAVVIKAGGDWERRLCRLLELRALEAVAAGQRGALDGSGPVNPTRLDVVYEGLYGTCDLQAAAGAADRVLLFAGGAGITPVASVLESLLRSTTPPAAPSPPPMSPPRRGAGDALFGGVSAATSGAAGVTPSATGRPGVYGAPNEVSNHPTTAAAVAAALTVAMAPEGIAPRVHLVWAVTQLSDAQPLMRLLHLAAARGWQVDIHLTRSSTAAHLLHGHHHHHHSSTSNNSPALLPPPTHVSVSTGQPPVAVTPTPAAQVAVLCPGSGTAAATADGGAYGAKLTSAYGPAKAATTAAATAAAKRPVVPAAAVAAPMSAPWQLHGAACWAVAAVAATVGAAGRNLGSAAASVRHCTVPGPDGVGDGDSKVSAWLSSVHAAFAQTTAAVGSRWTDVSAGSGTGGSAGRLLRAFAGMVLHGGGGGDSRCPTSVDIAATGLGAGGLGGGSGAGGAASVVAVLKHGRGQVNLRVCSLWGASDQLCVKCDPFVARTALEQPWPCCTAPICFFAARTAPLLGWLVGVLLGALLACLIWRQWCGRQRGPCRASGAAIACGPSVWWRTLGDMRGDGRGDALRAARGSNAAEGPAGAAVPLLAEGAEGDGVEDVEALTAPRVEVGEPGLDGLLSDLVSDSAAVTTSGKDGVAVRVHVGRPDVESYIRAAAASPTGGAGVANPYRRWFGREADAGLVYGVVVCGPESLTGDVQAAYERHVAGGYRGSWFKGFSFTT